MSIDLRKPFISKIRVEGRLQMVQYEGLPNMCFNCGLYGHGADICRETQASASVDEVEQLELEVVKDPVQKSVEEDNFGPWMLKERR